MKTGFNIMFVNSIDSEASKRLFKAALRDFKREYRPASFVEITHVDHLGISYNPKREEFEHSFSVHWQEPK